MLLQPKTISAIVLHLDVSQSGGVTKKINTLKPRKEIERLQFKMKRWSYLRRPFILHDAKSDIFISSVLLNTGRKRNPSQYHVCKQTAA